MEKFIDLTGQKFNEWTVLEYCGNSLWKCQCSCGVIKNIASADLRNGKSTSCGHTRLNNITGKTFGEWKVLRYVGNYKWECQCSCGKIEVIDTYSLTSGHSKSCGHARLIDLTGQKFGELEVLKYDKNKKWICKCSCGKIKSVSGHALRNGKVKSCGHWLKNYNPQGYDNKFIDITGKQFGEWTVLKYVGKHKWLCRCSCGVESIVASVSLRKGESKSCGHDTAKLKDITNQRFGQLVTTKYLGKSLWECKCDCGNTIQINGYYLRKGLTKHCSNNIHSYIIDLKNKQFGELLVQDYAGGGKWNCICSCGNKVQVYSANLRSGGTQSCGCKTRENRGIKLINSGYIKGRTIEQFNATASKEALLKYIGNEKITLVELAKKLGVAYGSAVRIKKELELDDIIISDNGISALEKEVLDFVKSIYTGEIIENTKKIIPNTEIDIFIPEYKIGIEFNGTYWHCDDMKGTYYHQEKSIKAFQNHIRIIHIFEYEWVDKSKKEKIQRYLRDILSETNKIYAKYTDIEEISSDIAYDFEVENHLQGSATSNINIGLKYNGELLGLMTFGKPRFNNNFEYELIRLCFKSGYNIVGGSEKMFKYFKEKYKPSSIVSYCDIAKFSGNTYFKLGFKTTRESLTSPNYVWVEPGRTFILSRYQSQKQRLMDLGLGKYGNTETEIMKNMGFLRVYDSGNMRFTWEV